MPIKQALQSKKVNELYHKIFRVPLEEIIEKGAVHQSLFLSV